MSYEPEHGEAPSGADDLRPQGLSELAKRAATPAESEPAPAPGAPVEPVAFISDIHSNLEALTAVLADIDARGLKRVVCLGDVVGYGPNPRECLDVVAQRCETCLMGNHDFAVLYEPYNFNTAAENATYWTRQQLEADPDAAARHRRWRYLGNMPQKVTCERFSAFHGSPRRPINEYVFPDDIYTAPQKLAAIFDRIPRICFVGHTHVPGVFVPDPEFYSPEELGGTFQIGEQRAMINVGSVGQPRDRNPQASYAILHDRHVEFVRVAYDAQATVEKVKALEALDRFLGVRLLEGR